MILYSNTYPELTVPFIVLVIGITWYCIIYACNRLVERG